MITGLSTKIHGLVAVTAILWACSPTPSPRAQIAGHQEPHSHEQGSGHRHGPPPEAFAACNALTAGAACAMQTRQGSLSGTCSMPPQASRLVCMPQGGPPRANGAERGGRRMREHTVTQTKGAPTLRPATVSPIDASIHDIALIGDWRVLTANGVSGHMTGPFPNNGNPNSIVAQSYEMRVPASPRKSATTTSVSGYSFGLAVNGVPFDPGAAEFYKGIRGAEWQYEPLSGAIDLGLDENHAHVQPNGAYHYHGWPTLLLRDLGTGAGGHSPLIGWAADGFPIYAANGYRNPADPASDVIEMASGYRLASGPRRSGERDPGGMPDGTFIGDYAYAGGTDSLDECNGRDTVTPEFPQGTYAYFVTHDWPVVPRCFRGTPSPDFAKRRR